MGNVILRAQGITKVFGDLVANHDIDLEVEAGSIHAIAGENGAGKSTLMKVLYGVYPATKGKIYIDGKPMDNWDPSVARENGISMVFQDFRIVPAFTVLENVFLSLTHSGFLLRKKALRERIRELSEMYHLNVDPDQEAWKLDLGQRQHIEIIKVLINSGTRIMIFDEPTSVLAPHEVDSFLDMLLQFRKNGYGILLITHKIHEIIQVADRITVLRHGEKAGSISREENFDRDKIISMMLGENLYKMNNAPAHPATRALPQLPGISLKGISIQDDHNREILQDINIELTRGQIVGVAGISGNGQRELAEAIFGARKIRSGTLLFGNEDITQTDPGQRIDLGFRMVTEDPLHDNVVPRFTILQNMALAGLPVKTRWGNIDWKDLEVQWAQREEIKELNVPSPDRRAGMLSGGNVQRMAFARAVVSKPSLLLASYPSRGLDVATVAEVHRTLFRLRDEGTAILLISEDLAELFELSDRIMVLAAQTTYGPFVPENCDINEIGRIMLKGGDENASGRAV